jgi:hypothetical protein
MFPVRNELGFYIPEDGILHSHRRENLKPYINVFRRISTWIFFVLLARGTPAQNLFTPLSNALYNHTQIHDMGKLISRTYHMTSCSFEY